MRPIVKPDLPDAYFAIPPSALLLQSFGEYCCVSEQPLSSNHYVWHKRLAVEHSAPVSRTYWQNLLLLCENSYFAQMGKQLPPNLLFPDESPLTFLFTGSSPFLYELRSVGVIIVDDDGRELSSSKSELVIVEGTNEEAEETIRFFALNSQFYNHQNDTLTIPIHALLSGYDRRVQQRTRAWQLAVDFARALRESEISDRLPAEPPPLILQGRKLAAATGYWSTWASALDEQE